jgi:tetratricopeptide (TPR) repeat protein
VYYPDRPLRNGFGVETVELYGDIIKKLQACGAFDGTSTTTPKPNAPSTTTPKPIAPSTTTPGTSASPYITHGDKYREAKRYPEAVEAYKKSIAIEPSIGAYSRLGVLYLDDLKQYPEALAAFQAAARLKPDDATLQYNLGLTFKRMQQYEKAIGAFREALRLKPDSAAAANLLGATHYSLDQYVEAIAAHKEAVRLEPNNATYIYNLGLTNLELGRKEDALVAYNVLQRVNAAKAKELYDEIKSSFGTPDNDLANFDLGLSYYEVGARGYRYALRALRRVVMLKADPDMLGRAHYVIGEIYLDQKKPTQATAELEQAAGAYQQAIRLNPRDASNYFWLGTIDVELGRKDAALRVYRTLQRIDPAKAKELFEEINKKR